MKYLHILISILIVFILPNCLMVHSQEGSKEPLARLWNINNDEIPKYLSIEKNLSIVDVTLKQFLDENNFGGTYVDVLQNMIFVYTLNFTRAEEIKKLPEINPYVNILNFTGVSNSTFIMNRRFGDVSFIASIHKPFCMSYIDSKINNIVIISCQEDRNYSGNIRFERAIRGSALRPIFKYFTCIDNSTTNNNIPNINNLKLEKRNEIVIRASGGDGVTLENKVLDKRHLCTLGFWAKDDKNNDYFGLAAHCYIFNSSQPFLNSSQAFLTPWNSNNSHEIHIGEMFYRHEQIDFGLIIKKNEEVKPEPFIRDSINTNLFIEDLIEVSSNGVHLCHSGINSHVECGYVETLNGFLARGEFGVFTDLILSNVISFGGDSGGPVFSYKQDQKFASLNGIHCFTKKNFINGTLSESIGGYTTISSILSSVSGTINITIPTVPKNQQFDTL
ncbi:hypothetical protein C2G38_2246763 [Gigaspora rosea]|uniref:Peptidase S1 domain-containing protein n=1 Tax=Gigaspora rosea TaxID=44941 RepID=A0A397V5F5_9GLOM|nr:hypothetical protein C2G38_2246763 [Gigaspora rosea]